MSEMDVGVLIGRMQAALESNAQQVVNLTQRVGKLEAAVAKLEREGDE